jgi:hypothetical protein
MYQKDEEGRFYVSRNGDEPLFLKGDDTVGFVHLDAQLSHAYRTTPNAASVGSLYLSVMTGGNEKLYEAWRKAGLSKEKFIPTTKKAMYYSPSTERYFKFIKDREHFVTFDREKKLCYYDESSNEKYYLDSRGNELFFRYKPRSNDKYFYAKIDGSVHWILSNNTDELLFYEKTDANRLNVYSVGRVVKNTIAFPHDVPISQELDDDRHIVCYVWRQDRKEYFWYENGRLVKFDYYWDKRRYEASDDTYFEFDERGDKKPLAQRREFEEEEEAFENKNRIMQRIVHNLDYVVFVVCVLLVTMGVIVNCI